LREHLIKAWEAGGEKPARFDKYHLPELFEQSWQDFLELHNARSSNGFGVNPISYLEIDAWTRLNRITLSLSDIKIIKALDNVFLKQQAKESKKRKP
jgi:hypothetical protein